MIDMLHCSTRWPRCRLSALIAISALSSAPLLALDYVTIRQGDKQRELAGKVEVEAVDGGVLLLTPDGVLWPLPKKSTDDPPAPLPKEEMVNRRSDDKPFVPLSRDLLAKQLTTELPGARIHKTQHYLIAYNTSPAYAQWVGSLFERLHGAFYNYWTRRGAELHEPEFPLVAFVFGSKDSYAQHARSELGDATDSIIGYYSLRTNRMTMYDLTGLGDAAGERNSTARINQILSQPDAERTVATIVHEATHQLAFNSGLQVRFADIPFWVSEGIAIYFETPDLESTKGWRNIGGVNRVNNFNFRKYLRTRPPGSLETLLCDDKRFRDAAMAADAYAEAWALNYFLLRTRSEAYVKYLKLLAEQTPLQNVEREERLKQFRQFFGEDLAGLEAEFLRYMRGVN
jgi:uncharacterized protein DUF1570